MCLKMPTQSSMPEPDTVSQTENKSENVNSTEDTEPASDEVKVYDEEEAEDERLEPAGGKALSDTKSSLINEAEQKNENPRALQDFIVTSKQYSNDLYFLLAPKL